MPTRGGAESAVAACNRMEEIARYLDRVVPVVLIVPESATPVDLSGAPRGNFIDDQVYALLSTLRIEPSPPLKLAPPMMTEAMTNNSYMTADVGWPIPPM